MTIAGVAATGHPLTAEAAKIILEEGGNAFDAVVAAHLAACVTEPVLASLGGGGFLMSRTAQGDFRLYDFFTQTPKEKRPAAETDFFPIQADFGTITQEFHIGLGSIAVPGAVHGLFTIQRDLCRMPFSRLIEPAVKFAREGIEVNAFQAYICDIVKPILLAHDTTGDLYRNQNDPSQPIKEGDRFCNPMLADLLGSLAQEGEALFYRGDVAHSLLRDCHDSGGHLTARDLESYQTIRREPLQMRYRDANIYTNPTPSCGGILIAFALQLLEHVNLEDLGFGSYQHLDLLTEVMALTNKARIDSALDQNAHQGNHSLFDPDFVRHYREQVIKRTSCSRGTTHFSVIDKEGNVASMTVSNGEGAGYMIPATGIMLNNMLGEEDLHPHGFHQWHTDQRIVSMMAPTITMNNDGTTIAIGSGGSNRIRSAILQTLSNLNDFGMSLEDAIHSPRIHFERGLLNIEPDIGTDVVKQLQKRFSDLKQWEEYNLFFGGVHGVMCSADGSHFTGTGDPRRGGHASTALSK